MTGSGSVSRKCSPSSCLSQSPCLASETDQAVLYDPELLPAAAACLRASLLALLSSMIFLRVSTLCLVRLSCSSCNCFSVAARASASAMKVISWSLLVSPLMIIYLMAESASDRALKASVKSIGLCIFEVEREVETLNPRQINISQV